MRDVVRRAFVWSLFWVFLFGGVGGWMVAKRLLGRVEAMTLTTRSIMAGDLGGRLAIAGTGDELDRLAESLNTMLGRIEELMAGMRQVSDNIAHDLKTPLTRLRQPRRRCPARGAHAGGVAYGAGRGDRGERQSDPRVQRTPDDRAARGRQCRGSGA